MSKFNRFLVELACPSCSKDVLLDVQADIGHLRWADFSLGDRVYDLPWTPKKPFGPSVKTDFSKPFWALGLARCPACAAMLRYRVHIRDTRFVGVSAADPTDGDDAWGVGSKVAESDD
jgi:hypothetical protein